MFEQLLSIISAANPTLTGIDSALMLLILRIVYLNHKDLEEMKHEFQHLQSTLLDIDKTMSSTEEYSKDTYKLIQHTPLNHLYYKDGQILKVY